MHLARLLLLAAAFNVVVAVWPPAPCFVSVNDVNAELYEATVIERPCFATIYSTDSPFAVNIRAYPRDAAMLVEASIPDDEGNTFQDNLFFTAAFLFGYIGGDNAQNANLTDARTAPFILRPVSPERGDQTWVGAMALAPSLWPAGSSPPAPTSDNVDVRPFGEVVIASVPVLLPAAPTEDDFRSAYNQLEELISFAPAGAGQWAINVTSPLTPSFSFYFTQNYNGTSFLIEASAEVYYIP